MSAHKASARSVAALGLVLATFTSAHAGFTPSDLLAPGPKELDDALTELEARLDRADAAATALIRTHNALGEALATAQGTLACDAPAIGYVARTEPLGSGYRDRVQAARAQGERVATIAAAPTVQSLAKGPVKARTSAATTRLAAHERGYAEIDAWQKRFVLPIAKRCHPQLAPSSGLGEPASDWVAFVALAPGRICPSNESADGFALARGPVCLSIGTCACAPSPVAPGAVLSAAAP
jgi:hypothetical protein